MSIEAEVHPGRKSTRVAVQVTYEDFFYLDVGQTLAAGLAYFEAGAARNHGAVQVKVLEVQTTTAYQVVETVTEKP